MCKKFRCCLTPVTQYLIDDISLWRLLLTLVLRILDTPAISLCGIECRGEKLKTWIIAHIVVKL